VSHYASLEAAVAKQRDSPWLGAHVAVLPVPDDAPVRFEQTGTDEQHYTLWAEPGVLRWYVVSVLPNEGLH
jgi:hypothetical protein